MIEPLWVLGGALAFDLVLGEPPAALHPVVWMGRIVTAARWRAPRAPVAAFAYGSGLALGVPLLFALASRALIVELAGAPVVRVLIEIYLLKSAFAIRALAEAARRVARALEAGDLAAARTALRSLVSREPQGLDAGLCAAAAVESVAENGSDSVVAPLFYFVLAGVPGALAYRAVNTLDSMIGYHGETEWLGKAAARLDDLANWIPARLTAALIALAAAFAGASPRGALRIWQRDGGVTESPNAGRPMAAMAGALAVRLEKVDHYQLGDGEVPSARQLAQAVEILHILSALAAALTAAACALAHA